MSDACEFDTRFSFFKRENRVWFFKAFCGNDAEGCSYIGDDVRVVKTTYDDAPIVSFSHSAEEHIKHLLWSRDVIEP